MKTRLKKLAIWFTIFVLAFQVIPVFTAKAETFPQRVNVNSDGSQAIQTTSFSNATESISADGRYVVFGSDATNLVPGDTNGTIDIFLRDRQTSETTRVSVASDGTQGNGHSYMYFDSISANGRYVVFYSSSTNLVPGGTATLINTFVHDCQTGETKMVSISSNGSKGNSGSYSPIISSDGRYVAFRSYATNLVSNDTNNTTDVFEHDLQTGETTRVSVASDGTEGNSNVLYYSISADGRYIAFASNASNLVSYDTNGQPDIFVRDLQTSETKRVSLTSDGTQLNSAGNPKISADGRYVAFDSSGIVLIHDMQTSETNALLNIAGTSYNGISISADNRYVAFKSSSSNIIPGDTNDQSDIFVYDIETNKTAMVSNAYDGVQGNGQAQSAAISADGRYVVFNSNATNLVFGDTNSYNDIFLTENPLYTPANLPPLSTPGPAQTIPFNTTVNLDGSASSDPDGDTPLTYAWSFSSAPVGSVATIDSSDTPYPSFIADKIGDYIVSLTVTDSKGLASQPVTTTITAVNVPPVASAGTNQSAFVGNTVNLGGDQSSDANGDALTYHWSLTSVPEGSQATLTSTNNMTTSFIPDNAGQYTASLTVNDGLVDSEVSTINIAVTTYQVAATEQLGTLDNSIVAIPTTTFNSINSQNALTNKINAALASIERGNYSDALSKLQSDILGKTDGCVTSGKPDKNDWITTCDTQNQVYPIIIEIIGYLRHL